MSPVPGICSYCGCTDNAPCVGGCAWADEDRTLCSTCAVAEGIAEKLIDVLGAAASSAQLRLARSAWPDLAFEQRQLLVTTCRATVESIQESLLEGLAEDAVEAGVELNAITSFLYERCPEQLVDGEGLPQTVMRLLGPHVGSRIVLP